MDFVFWFGIQEGTMRAYPKKLSRHNSKKSPDGMTRCPMCQMLFADVSSMHDHLFFCRLKLGREERTDGWRQP